MEKRVGRNTEGDANGKWYVGYKTEEEAFNIAKSLNRKTIKKCGHCCK